MWFSSPAFFFILGEGGEEGVEKEATHGSEFREQTGVRVFWVKGIER